MLTVIVTITGSSIYSANIYCVNNGGSTYSVNSYCDNKGEVYMQCNHLLLTVNGEVQSFICSVNS